MKSKRRVYLRVTAAGVAVLVVAVNLVAYRQAWCMTHFTTTGERTIKPENLTPAQRAGVVLRGVVMPKPLNTSLPGNFGLASETVHITTRDGVALELWDIPADGAADIVLMFHGYGGCKGTQLREAALFHSLGKHVALVDFRGSGGSAGNVTTIGWMEAQDVAAAVQWSHEKYPGKRLLLFGQSMGAVAALRAVRTESIQPAGLILECPFDTLVHTVNHRFEAMRLPAFPFAQLLVFWGGVQVGIDGFHHNGTAYARAVQCPTLLLWGEDDARVSRREVEAVAAGLAGRVEFKTLTGVGHQSYYRAQPDRYREIVQAWFERKG